MMCGVRAPAVPVHHDPGVGVVPGPLGVVALVQHQHRRARHREEGVGQQVEEDLAPHQSEVSIQYRHVT